VATVDILIPAYTRPGALAATLTALMPQTFKDFRVVVSDQSEDSDLIDAYEVIAVVRILRTHGHVVDVFKHTPPRGMAEQRQFLLDQASAPYVLFIDDDIILEPDMVERLLKAIREEGCGFVGAAVVGLSFIKDVRPHQQHIEFWKGPVQPEQIRPDTPEWERYRLHNAANVLHVAQRLGITPEDQRKYKIAWVGGCGMYDTKKLRDIGGFNFWRQLPPVHCGEDVVAQIRVMSRYGGCGIIPTGAYHQELPTTLPDRSVNAPMVLSLEPPLVGMDPSFTWAYGM